MNDFDAIYQQYGKTVYCFLLSLSRDESLAEELTQETMFRAIMNINSFRGDSKPSVWLCQIGKNLYFEWLKKSKRTIPIDDSLATYDSGYDIAEAFADKDIANQILKYDRLRRCLSRFIAGRKIIPSPIAGKRRVSHPVFQKFFQFLFCGSD